MGYGGGMSDPPLTAAEASRRWKARNPDKVRAQKARAREREREKRASSLPEALQ